MSTNLSAKYYQENKKRLQTKKAHEGYQIFLKKKRKKKQKHGRGQNKNLSEDAKIKLIEYRKNIIE